MANLSPSSLPTGQSSAPAQTSAATSDTSTTASTSPSATPPPTSTSGTSTSTSTTTSTTSSSTSSTTSTTSTTSSTTSTSDTSTTASSTTSQTSSTSTSTSTTSSSTSGPSFISLTSTSTGLTTSNGQILTITSTAVSTGSATSSPQNDSTSKSFFQNKGAVAGVFAVVGLIVLVIVVALATNAVRRRRARKFDDDVAAAAAEAAATQPRYPFDDFDDPTSGGGSGGGGGYSGTYSDPESHGTYSQPPMTHGGESYNMSEFPGYGAAGVGAVGRSRSRKDSAGTDLSGPGIAGFGSSGAGGRNQAGAQPYPAYAGPRGQEMYDAPPSGLRARPSQRSHELFDVAAIAGAGAAAGAPLNRGPSQQNNVPSLARKQSSPEAFGSSQGHETYAAHYQPDFRADAHTYDQPAYGAFATPESTSTGGTGGAAGMPNPYSPLPQQQFQLPAGQTKSPSHEGEYHDDDAYAAESYFPSAPRPGFGHHEDSRLSFRDEDDYALEGGRRLLKVANE